MNILSLFDSNVFSWFILPFLIFISRIFDVSLGTMRIIFVARGGKFIAPFLGFFEVLVWLIAIGQIMQNLDNIMCYIAYAGGFAAGTFVGIAIEEKLAIGIVVIRVILTESECPLKDRLAASGFGVTVVDAKGVNGQVKVVYTIVLRKDINNVIAIINECNSKAFYSIEEARTAREGIFPVKHSNSMTGRLLGRLGK